MGPRSLLRDTLDTLGRFGDHVGSFGGFWVALWSSWGALWELWGGLWEVLGVILGAFFEHFLMDSGAFFGSQARPIMKRCFLGSQTTFCCFFIPCRKCGDRSHSKKPNVFATFSCHSRGVSFSVFVAIFICFLNYLDVVFLFFSVFLCIFRSFLRRFSLTLSFSLFWRP